MVEDLGGYAQWRDRPIKASANAAGHDGSSFVPRLPACTLLARLRSGEGAPSLFSSLLRSDEPEAPPPAAAEVAQAFRQSLQKSHRSPRTWAPRCPILLDTADGDFGEARAALIRARLRRPLLPAVSVTFSCKAPA